MGAIKEAKLEAKRIVEYIKHIGGIDDMVYAQHIFDTGMYKAMCMTQQYDSLTYSEVYWGYIKMLFDGYNREFFDFINLNEHGHIALITPITDAEREHLSKHALMHRDWIPQQKVKLLTKPDAARYAWQVYTSARLEQEVIEISNLI